MALDSAGSYMSAFSHRSFQQIEKLFEQALGRPDGPERQAWLKQACAGDLALEIEVRRLLDSDTEVRDRAAMSPPERLPRFGVFQARELIGTGGMGAVYRATREDGEVRQEVAVKVVGSVLWPAEMEQRFRRERQILAALDHPDIARFLDSGVTEDGVPYLVMELVQGRPIDSWCDEARLPLKKRLELFLKICDAVGFAHRKLVVHRDLKPGNILVSNDGQPKLLDFGIARTLNPQPDGDAATRTAGMAFTPRYASPEQIRGEIAGVSCDIYSLGVLLFELLTGASPFSREGSAPADTIAMVLQTEAGLPSSSVPESCAAAARGLDSPAALRRVLRGDLDAIVTKAVAKSPAERYSSAEDFAADVRRYLSGFPVHAASTSGWYRVRKFAGRHRAALAAAVLVACSLGAGIATTLWQAGVAGRRFSQTRSLARYMMFDLTQSVAALPGSTPVQADMVKHSIEYLDALSAERMGDSALRTEAGEGYLRLAALLGHPNQANLGDLSKAQETYRKAIAILEPESRDPGNRRAMMDIAKARDELGQVLGFNSESGEGLQLIQAAANDLARLAERWPADADIRLQASISFENLALALSRPHGYIINRALDRSIPALRLAEEHARAAADIRPGEARPLRQLAMCLKVRADFTELNDHAEAGAVAREALATLDRISPQDQKLPLVRNSRSSVLLMLGDNLRGSGDLRGARAVLEEARQIRDGLWKEDPENMLLLRQRLDPYDYLLRLAAKPEQLRCYQVLDGIYQALTDRYPSSASMRFDWAAHRAAAANLEMDLGQPQEALRLARLSFPVLKEIALDPQALGITQSTAAAALVDAKVPGFADPKLALELAQHADASYGSKDSETLEILARAYWANGNRQAAVGAQERALALMAKGSPLARQEAEQALARYRGRK